MVGVGFAARQQIRQPAFQLLGYNNISSFTTAFKSWYDMPPAEYRQKFLAF